MSEWSDEFFEKWRNAWNTRTEDVMDLVTDDIEYWDPTLMGPITNIQDYAVRLDRFFEAMSDARWRHSFPPIYEEIDEHTGRASETWTLTGVNTGDLWTGHPATGRSIETQGVDVYEFRDGKVCRQYSYFDVLESLRQLGVEPKGSVRRKTVTATFGPDSREERALEVAAATLGGVAASGRKIIARLPGRSLLKA